jgi:hypothetical protein
MDVRYPGAETVFEYSVDVKNRQWLSWDSKLSGGFKPRPDIPAYRLLVPTADTLRNTFVAGALVRSNVHTLVVGGVGVGKSMTLSSLLEGLPGHAWASCTINFSAQTSSNSLQVGVLEHAAGVLLRAQQPLTPGAVAARLLPLHTRRTRLRASWRSAPRACLRPWVADGLSRSSTTSTCPRRASLALCRPWSCSSCG